MGAVGVERPGQCNLPDRGREADSLERMPSPMQRTTANSLGGDAPTSNNGRQATQLVVSAVRSLPDVADETRPHVPGLLDRVGMSGIETVVALRGTSGTVVQVPARADATVDLVDPAAKGIHMSRLYLALQQGLSDTELTPPAVAEMLRDFVDSQANLCSSAHIGLEFEQMLLRSSLLSSNAGWRSYPVRIDSQLRGSRVEHSLSVAVTYSSTCPCSAALSRQLMQDGFDEDFAGQSMIAAADVRAWLGGERAVRGLPHAQRSRAEVTVVFEDADDFGIVNVIDVVEDALGTAVQSAVKRADEQEFARLNALNLMFCEDAARRIRSAVDGAENVQDFRIGVRHLESLHAHDAVALVTKGVPGGLTADTRPFGLSS